MKKLLLSTVALFMTQSSFALSADVPTTCPSVNAIRSVGVSIAEKYRDDIWMTFETRNNYGTENDWSFGMFAVTANSSNEAVDIANQQLSSLTYISGPTEFTTPRGRVVWECRYEGHNPYYQAATVTPAVLDQPGLLDIIRK